MSEQDFLMKMQEEILDTEDEITMGTKLSDIEEWDSLAFVSFMAVAKMSGVTVDRTAVHEADTVGNLYHLLGM